MRVRPRPRPPVAAAVAAVLAAVALLAAPGWSVAPAGAAPRGAAGPGGGTELVAPGQQGPDAPADDGTSGSSDEGEEVGEPVPADDIIPLPNSGREPSDAGDRGGALQILLLVAIVAGVGGATAMVVRESRRNRDRARQP